MTKIKKIEDNYTNQGILIDSNVNPLEECYEESCFIEDNIRLVNQTSVSNISFKVYAHDSKTFIWVVYGEASLKGNGDTAFVRSKLSGKLDKYRYFAIEALDGNDYNYNYYESRDDLYINIHDK